MLLLRERNEISQSFLQFLKFRAIVLDESVMVMNQIGLNN